MNEQLPSLEGERAVAIHRDYTPRNWRVHGDGTLAGVIDFEHARWDVRAADLNRSPDYEFVGNPHLRSAFFEGYGTPSSRLEAQIEILRLQNAVAAIVWGVLVNELDYSNRNRVALERIMAESCQM
jgi:Ser/Thr protein kinase RdoA (MazF antagonist)